MPNLPGARTLELIELAYDCACRPGEWQAFCDQLSRELGDAALSLMLDDAWSQHPRRLYWAGVSAEMVQRYRSEFYELDPWRESELSVPPGTVVVHREPTPEAVSQTVYYRDLLQPEGLAPGPRVSVPLVENGGQPKAVLSVLPRLAGPPLRHRELELLRALGPHLVRASALSLQIDRGRATHGGLREALDQLRIGVLLTDRRGLPVYANRSAAEILGVDPDQEPARMLRRLREAFRGLSGQFRIREGAEGIDSLLVRHPVDQRSLPAIASHLTGGTSVFGHDARHAIFIGDPQRPSASPVEMLRNLYGLTRAEARLTALLVTGSSLSRAARDLGIAEGTARKSLKRVFTKTRVNRQVDLIRLVLSAPGALRPGRKPHRH